MLSSAAPHRPKFKSLAHIATGKSTLHRWQRVQRQFPLHLEPISDWPREVHTVGGK